jgi:hypothetical protein
MSWLVKLFLFFAYSDELVPAPQTEDGRVSIMTGGGGFPGGGGTSSK